MEFLHDSSDGNLCLTVSTASPGVHRFELQEGLGDAQVIVTFAALPELPRALVAGLRALDRYVIDGFPADSLHGIGRELARLLPAEIHDRLLALVHDIKTHDLRLWLDIQAVELGDLPWEYLFLPSDVAGSTPQDGPGFLALHPRIHVLRRPSGVGPAIPPTTLPLRILIAAADPQSPNHPNLSYLDEEIQLIKDCMNLLSRDHVDYHVLEGATPSSLERKMRGYQPHILHFIGHGERCPSGHRLVLERGIPHSEDWVYANELAEWAIAAGTRLVVLSACFTGAGVGGIAPTLARQGVPGVVAMQLPLRDACAGRFARALYSALAGASGIDVAVARGREALREFGPDWGVPVLYVAVDTELFRFPSPPVRTNLSIDETEFIGRKTEVSTLKRRLLVHKERIVTITGIGGMGKSRLANEVAMELLPDFPDGVWRIDCTLLRGADQIIEAICSTLGISIDFGMTPRRIGQALAKRRLLLLLDGFEKCADHAPLLEEILRAVDGVSLSTSSAGSPNRDSARIGPVFLVTSHRVLHLAREFEFSLQPMPTVERVVRNSPASVQLFADRADRAVPGGFAVNSGNRALVRSLCIALEGIPLRIVLAAPRLRYMTLSELAEKVRALPVDPYMQATIADSFNDLPLDSQRLLVSVCAFSGGFGYDDAAAVCPSELVPYIDLHLASLRDHSLLIPELVDDRTRFRMLETVREYLTSCSPEEMRAELNVCAERHARHYARLAQQVDVRMQRGEWAEASVQLWREIANIRHAVRYSIGNHRQELVLDFAQSVARTYLEAGLWGDFETLATAAERAAREGDRIGDLIRLRGLQGALARRRHEEAAGRSFWEDRLVMAREIGDLAAVVDTLADLAIQSHEADDTVGAQQLLQQATEICVASRMPAYQATIYAMQSRCAVERKDMNAARDWAQKARGILTIDADKEQLSFIYLTLGYAYIGIGDKDAAASMLRTGIRVAREGQRVINVVLFLLALATLFVARNDDAKAALAYAIAKQMDIPPVRLARVVEEARRLEERHNKPTLQRWQKPAYELPWQKAVNYLLD